ncbi:MAG: OmpA family protein [Acidobacteriota bacterium]
MKQLSRIGQLILVVVIGWGVAGAQFPGPPGGCATPKLIGKKMTLRGLIVERPTDRFTLQQDNGRVVGVKLTNETRLKEKRKNFLRDPKIFRRADLIAGLRVEVKGRCGSSGFLVAREVKFRQDDLKVARVMESRLVPVQNRIDEMAQGLGGTWGQVTELAALTNANRFSARRAQKTADQALSGIHRAERRLSAAEEGIHFSQRSLSSLDDYRVEDLYTVHFAAGSSILTDGAKEILEQLAGKLRKTKGLLLEVTGFASADGPEDFNRRLSLRRAQAVVSHLSEQRRIPLRQFVTPFGYGELRPVADNSGLAGRRKNRRVEVKVLVNQGLAQVAQLQ